MVTLDEKYAKDIKALQEELRKGLPKSARTDYFVGNQGGDGGGGGNHGVQVQLVGDSSSMLQEIGQEVVPLAQRAELRDVRIDNGEKGGELKVRVDRERAAAFGFNAEQVASFVGLACAVRRCASSAAATMKYRYGALRWRRAEQPRKTWPVSACAPATTQRAAAEPGHR